MERWRKSRTERRRHHHGAPPMRLLGGGCQGGGGIICSAGRRYSYHHCGTAIIRCQCNTGDEQHGDESELPESRLGAFCAFGNQGFTADIVWKRRRLVQFMRFAGKKLAVRLGISLPMAFLVVSAIITIICVRYRIHWHKKEDLEKKMDKTMSAKSIAALESQYLPNKTAEDVQPFESERPVTFSLEEVKEATANFDETRKIGEGGFGSVYFGMIGKQEVAIKKMKSSKSKEFFAELKVLCKVHHINVVELIGYAAGDDNLYLVYEFVQNGSLSEHLHDPLLKGHQPLSWNARVQIALDAARGIEYIHDHTKAQYVHRDIKTSNILLDDGLRAKVADFGLAKLVERSAEDDCIATRLVGTPGYLPPELVRELQMTTKTDVFAFGVVIAELITGHRALLRDNKEPTKMKSLISIMKGIFQEDDPESALEAIIDGNLNDSYPIEEVYKMADIAMWCFSDEPLNRPEMREITVKLAQIVMASIEWEASLGGNSQVFSGVFNGR
ncbi:lysM domain receptor-like kinase 3 isoform X2 [Elaeis guineensis]|uniref:lysM domain receptor-like kinase 3 isoform X2 n=1 Tax=Elaeis guineensis var. tenera TaxID=51953 RepID=UPI003C6D4ACD